MLRIAFLTDYLGTLAGTEASLVDTSVELRRRGHRVRIGVFPREEPVHPHWAEILHRHDIPLTIAEADEQEAAFCWRFESELRRWGAQAVHAFPMGRLLLAWLELDTTADLPCVATETSEGSHRCTWYDPASFSRFRPLTAVIAPCETVASGVRSTMGFEGRIVVIPHLVPVPDERIAPLTATAIGRSHQLGAITRLRVEKGPEYLLATLRQLRRERDVTLTIYGETPDLERVSILAQALEVADSLYIAGPFKGSSEIDAIIDSHVIFLLSSVFEGLPLALLQATARGRVCVAADVGGVREILGEGVGRVVPVADPAAMASAVSKLLDDPETMLDCSRRAVAAFRSRFHIDQVFPRLVSLYHELAEQPYR